MKQVKNKKIVGLRAKLCSYEIYENSTYHKKCTSVKKMSYRNVLHAKITKSMRTNEKNKCNNKSSSQRVYRRG